MPKVYEIRLVIDHGHGKGEAVCGCGKTFPWSYEGPNVRLQTPYPMLICPECGASLNLSERLGRLKT
jgi:hypothetical protein